VAGHAPQQLYSDIGAGVHRHGNRAPEWQDLGGNGRQQPKRAPPFADARAEVFARQRLLRLYRCD
jgi:hypothetical protein